MLGASLLTVATLELLRAFLPGLLLVRPETGALPLAGAIGIGVAVVCLAPLLIAPATRWRPRTVWIAAVLAVAASRLALVTAPTGTALTVLAGVGTAAGLIGLVTLAASAPTSRGVRVGVLGGLAFEVLLRTATAGLGLVWSTTTWAGLLTTLLVAALVVVAGSLQLGPGDAAPRPVPPAWTWLWLLPAIVLTGALTGVTGRVAIATGWTPTQVATTIATAQVLGVLAALLAPRVTARRVGTVAAALLLVGTTASLTATGWSAVLGPIAVAVGIGALAGIEVPRVDGVPVLRRALVPAAALAGGGAVLLVYELAATSGLPGNTRPLLLLGTAVGAAVLGLALGRLSRAVTVRGQLRPVPLVLSLVLGGVSVGVVALLSPPTLRPMVVTDPTEAELIVAAYEVSGGFGLDGRYDPEHQAQLLRAEDVDLVLLTGVERGSWLAGGQDLLPLLHAHLGLEYVQFAPAGSELAGHALFSRHPITEFVSEPLPGGRRAAVHSQLAAVVTLPDGAQLGVIGTQLAVTDAQAEARLPQARAVAGNVARLRERQLPTVLLGDLGGPLEGAVLDSFAPLLPGSMPDGARNFPAAAPTQLRHHVLLSPELQRTALAIPAVPAATHLPVVVTVRGVEEGS